MLMRLKVLGVMCCVLVFVAALTVMAVVMPEPKELRR